MILKNKIQLKNDKLSWKKKYNHIVLFHDGKHNELLNIYDNSSQTQRMDLPPEEKTDFDHFIKTHWNVFRVQNNQSLFLSLIDFYNDLMTMCSSDSCIDSLWLYVMFDKSRNTIHLSGICIFLFLSVFEIKCAKLELDHNAFWFLVHP